MLQNLSKMVFKKTHRKGDFLLGYIFQSMRVLLKVFYLDLSQKMRNFNYLVITVMLAFEIHRYF